MPDQIAKAKCPVRARYKALSGHALRTGSMVRPDIASSGRSPGPGSGRAEQITSWPMKGGTIIA